MERWSGDFARRAQADTSHRCLDAIGYLEAMFSAAGFGILIIFIIFFLNQQRAATVEQIYSVFKVEFVLFPILHPGKRMKSHLQENFGFSKAFSLKEKWMFKTPCPPSKIQAENLYQTK